MKRDLKHPCLPGHEIIRGENEPGYPGQAPKKEDGRDIFRPARRSAEKEKAYHFRGRRPGGGSGNLSAPGAAPPSIRRAPLAAAGVLAAQRKFPPSRARLAP